MEYYFAFDCERNEAYIFFQQARFYIYKDAPLIYRAAILTGSACGVIICKHGCYD